MESRKIPDCTVKVGKLSKVSFKGYASLVKASRERNDEAFSLPMSEGIVQVHEQCRRRYISQKMIAVCQRKAAERSMPVSIIIAYTFFSHFASMNVDVNY